ncbi:MAG: glycerol kinase GlpK [Eubacteriaceae bacterium]|jgi:glycerol kinase|nr:glycerol kinase GlpK [Eubacteriaceae bacterium]
MSKYVMALDQGTTSSRCILYNKQGEIISSAQKEFGQIFPQPGWVEHDAMQIWSTQVGVALDAMARIDASPEDIAAIGITNQRETAVVWDRETGLPVYNAIVWQCRRTAELCGELKECGCEDKVREKTGLILDPYFSGTKIKWILDNVAGARKKADEGKLLFGTIETWLIWKLTDGAVHVTDYSNASRTMLFNIHDLDWDDELLEMLDIPRSMLPKPVPSSMVYGETDKFGGKIKIAGAAGDQQASLFGQTCFSQGESKMTYGTGGFLLLNTGSDPILSKHGLLTTVAWGIDGAVNYALEGSVFVAGAAIQWLRDEMGLMSKSSESEAMAEKVNDSGGVYVVPAFTGLGAPYWDPYARGTIIGITRGTNVNHIVRATLESLAYQTKDLVDAMLEDTGEKLQSFRVDGGACANNFMMQFQSDILGIQVIRPKVIETTSLGAAYLAGLAVGFWKDKEDVIANAMTDRVFEPEMDMSERQGRLDEWHEAVKRSMGWCK